LEEAAEIFCLPLVARDEAPGAHEPREESFDEPAPAIAPKRPTILRLAPATRMVRRNHLDAFGGELGIEWIAVVCGVADELLGQWCNEASVQSLDDELLLISRTTRNPTGDRKTMAVCHRHDLGRFAASSLSNQRAPLLAPAWEPSM